ncbi:MAG: DUF2203 domain-containing protein [Actinomycetota bacterium]|nr:DUF2203 domain-containing protein [Actinomycetota bacterium]
MTEERRYTVEEAESVLPDIRGRLERIRDARQELFHSSEVIKEHAAADGGGFARPEYWDALETLRAEVSDLSERDIILRDAETGLIDFPAERDGRRILLCWRLGEEHVSHWHDPEAGFAGRRRL